MADIINDYVIGKMNKKITTSSKIMKKKNIVWSVWSKNGNKLLKSGTIDGVKFSVIYKMCQKWSDAYIKRKFPNMIDKE